MHSQARHPMMKHSPFLAAALLSLLDLEAPRATLMTRTPRVQSIQQLILCHARSLFLNNQGDARKLTLAWLQMMNEATRCRSDLVWYSFACSLLVFAPDRLYSSGLGASLRFGLLGDKENHFRGFWSLICLLNLKRHGHEYEFVEVKDRIHDFGLLSMCLAYKVYPCPSKFLVGVWNSISLLI